MLARLHSDLLGRSIYIIFEFDKRHTAYHKTGKGTLKSKELKFTATPRCMA
jgi:hypothetical protein